MNKYIQEADDEQEARETSLYIQSCIKKLKEGGSTEDEVLVVKEYVYIVEESLRLFEESIQDELVKKEASRSASLTHKS